MNCDEAGEKLGWVLELPESHPERRLLEWHLQTCDQCSAELALWQQSMEMVHSMSEVVAEDQAEVVNHRVMDRIYAESPWLLEGNQAATDRKFRKRIKMWASSFMFIFLLSVCLYIFTGPSSLDKNQRAEDYGVIPTAVAGSDHVTGLDSSYDLTNVSSGIVEPYVVRMSPAYPQ